MRILIFGAGAIGGVLGTLLSKKHDVHLISRGEHLKKMLSRGLRIEGVAKYDVSLPAHEHIDGLGLFDSIIVTTKSYDTETAAKMILGHLKSGGCLLTVQNGIGNAEILAAIHGSENVVIGVTSMAANIADPGIIKYVAEDDITLGSLLRKSNSLQVASRIFKEANIRTRNSENINGVIWSKAILNASINSLTAIHRCKNVNIISDKNLKKQAVQICEEGIRIAAAKGIILEPQDVVNYMISVAKRTADNKSSMLMDIENGRRTEIESICGSILLAGKEVGIESPLISEMYEKITDIEKINLV